MIGQILMTSILMTSDACLLDFSPSIIALNDVKCLDVMTLQCKQLIDVREQAQCDWSND